MIKITDVYPVVLTVHDAAVVVTKKELADETLNQIMSIMSEPPEWATGLPVACEGHYGNSYGEC